MSKSDFHEAQYLNQWFGGVATTIPATYYVALFTTAPTDSTAGTEVSTATWTNYQRAPVTNNTTNFPTVAAGASKTNGAAISGFFSSGTSATTTGNVSVAGAAIMDAASGGNIIRICTLSGAPITVANGNTVSIASGALTLTED